VGGRRMSETGNIIVEVRLDGNMLPLLREWVKALAEVQAAMVETTAAMRAVRDRPPDPPPRARPVRPAMYRGLPVKWCGSTKGHGEHRWTELRRGRDDYMCVGYGPQAWTRPADG
jgi:hypothetical protein